MIKKSKKISTKRRKKMQTTKTEIRHERNMGVFLFLKSSLQFRSPKQHSSDQKYLTSGSASQGHDEHHPEEEASTAAQLTAEGDSGADL